MHRRRTWILRRVLISMWLAGFACLAWPVETKPLFTDAFPPEEFAARRTRLMAQIGDGVAVLQGATEYAAFVKFRQNNQVFYLTGLEVPRVIVVIDGRTKRATAYLQERNEREMRSEGPVMTPGPEAVTLSGLDEVLPRDKFAAALQALAADGRTLYLPRRAEALGATSPEYSRGHADKSMEDQWDGRLSRELTFLQRVKAQAPKCAIKDLDPLLDQMRLTKSAREIAVVREATRISALAIAESMRAVKPGMYEYELEAIGDYVFKKHNAQGFAYFALVAAGTNAWWPHYHAAQSRLADGDLVLYDYAPDYKYYTSDVTRMFPANGKFSPRQREMYGIYLKFYQALMSSIRPNVPIPVLMEDAVGKMERELASFTFADAKVKAAAEKFVDAYRRRGSRARTLGHWVGMEVHDVGGDVQSYRPGMIFTIEPALTLEDERVYVRLEDVILITESGYENMSADLPVEIDAIEKLMTEPGLSDVATGATASTRPSVR